MNNHGIVYQEEGVYAGWPANHGAWRSGDELLVGFLCGRYGRGGMHAVKGELLHMQARSSDGENWTVEGPVFPDVVDSVESVGVKPGIWRVRGSYDHGGDFVVPGGAYFASEDFGVSWCGPYAFPWQVDDGCVFTGRTCVLGDLIFVSQAQEGLWGTDTVECLKNTGERLIHIGTVCDGPGRAVMPSAVRHDGKIYVACRRRDLDCWIDLFSSADGFSWKHVETVASDLGDNGNPPSLVSHEGQLVCVFGDRRRCELVAQVIGGQRLTIRVTNDSDIGYPQAFSTDDGILATYYWADNNEQHIAWSRFSP